MSQLIPKLGKWYQDRESGQLFEIVSLDIDEANIQVQYLDGELADFEFDVWAELKLGSAAAPGRGQRNFKGRAEVNELS